MSENERPTPDSEEPRPPSQEIISEVEQRIVELAHSGSEEEIERLESVLRIITLTRESSMAVAQRETELAKHKMDYHYQRLESLVTATAEGVKLHFEAYKNLTVLDSGALVAFAVITRNLVPSPHYLSVLNVAYFCVLISLITSLVMMFFAGDRLAEILASAIKEEPTRGRVARTTLRVVAASTHTYALVLNGTYPQVIHNMWG